MPHPVLDPPGFIINILRRIRHQSGPKSYCTHLFAVFSISSFFSLPQPSFSSQTLGSVSDPPQITRLAQLHVPLDDKGFNFFHSIAYTIYFARKYLPFQCVSIILHKRLRFQLKKNFNWTNLFKEKIKLIFCSTYLKLINFFFYSKANET